MIDPGKYSRLTVRNVACVECGAEPGEPCKGRRGYRKANHATRIESYAARIELRTTIQPQGTRR